MNCGALKTHGGLAVRNHGEADLMCFAQTHHITMLLVTYYITIMIGKHLDFCWLNVWACLNIGTPHPLVSHHILSQMTINRLFSVIAMTHPFEYQRH